MNYQSRNLKSVFVVSLLILQSTLTWAASAEKDLNFKLIISKQNLSLFKAQKNIFKPSEKEKAKEYIEKIIAEAAFASMVPMLFQIRKTLVTENGLTLAKLVAHSSALNYLDLAREIESATAKVLIDNLEKIKKDHPEIVNLLDEPVTQDFYFVPWEVDKNNLFYDSHKISQSKYKLLSRLSPAAGSLGFEKILSKNIIEFQKRQIENSSSPAPVYLLGLRHFFLVDLHGKSYVTIRLLLGLNPNPNAVKDFKQTDPLVILDKVVIPDNKSEGLVANIQTTYALDHSDQKPQLSIHFGKFQSFTNGNFELMPGVKNESGPRLEGQLNRGGILGHVALNFTFTDVFLDLDSGKLSTVKTFISPGIRISGVNHVLGKIHKADVDEQFRNKINETIKAETEGIMNKILSMGGKQ